MLLSRDYSPTRDGNEAVVAREWDTASFVFGGRDSKTEAVETGKGKSQPMNPRNEDYWHFNELYGWFSDEESLRIRAGNRKCRL